MVYRYEDCKVCNYCGGDNLIFVKRVYSNGSINYLFLCKECAWYSACVKTDTIPEDKRKEAIDYDSDYIENIRENAKHNRQIMSEQKYQEYRQQAEELEEERKQAFFDMLREYYQSDAWQYRRSKRLEYNKKYFGGKCERCRKNDATCVHHRSYAVLGGMEHTFDLEALCEDCHKMLHPHMRSENDGTNRALLYL